MLTARQGEADWLVGGFWAGFRGSMCARCVMRATASVGPQLLRDGNNPTGKARSLQLRRDARCRAFQLRICPRL